MSSHTFQTVVTIPNETLWTFLHSMEDWHKVIPGIFHTRLFQNKFQHGL